MYVIAALHGAQRRRSNFRWTAAHREEDLSLTRLDFITVLLAVGTCVTTDALAQSNWPSAGADLNNSRYQATENQINANTVGSLKVKWVFATSGDVQAHPAVDGD